MIEVSKYELEAVVTEVERSCGKWLNKYEVHEYLDTLLEEHEALFKQNGSDYEQGYCNACRLIQEKLGI